MKGDFSSRVQQDELRKNYRGVLHQQGKVLLDEDWNAQSRIDIQHDLLAASDTIGEGVAAIPVSVPGSFLVESATADGNEATLFIHPGRAWVNGALVFLEGDPAFPDAPVARQATPLPEPWQSEPPDIEDGDRDAVVLEVWFDTLSAYQETGLLEPALGGVDTTERVVIYSDFRLFRLTPEDTCRSVTGQVQDDFSSKGTLTVTLPEDSSSGEPCPEIETGGYTGFEHYLYRVEIAHTINYETTPMFKWSKVNGGLCGRGTFVASGGGDKIEIKANLPAISAHAVHSPDFYVEILEKDSVSGLWKVTRGQKAVLNGSNLEFKDAIFQGSGPVETEVFFRLWDGVEFLSDFYDSAALLDNSLHLQFDSKGPEDYRPGDFWNFKVRAGMMDETDPLPDHAPPEGVHYMRVPLAILEWSGSTGTTVTYDAEEITDCRDLFRPLIQQNGCCSFQIGDGVNSHGDFDSLEEALFHLPESGGELCLLPGKHRTNLEIIERKNIIIRGCGKKTLVIPRDDGHDKPVFTIIDSGNITLEKMDIVSLKEAVILVKEETPGGLSHITLSENRIVAGFQAISAYGGKKIGICCNLVKVFDKEEGQPAIFVQTEECLIKGNRVYVIPAEVTPPVGDPSDGGNDIDPMDECDQLENFYGIVYLIEYIWYILVLFFDYYTPPVTLYKAHGGIQVGNGSVGVTIVENEIFGGAGNGITLGGGLSSRKVADENGVAAEEKILPVLRLIDIERNLIRGMGSGGIGVDEFYRQQASSFTTLEQSKIARNKIEMCLLGFIEPPEHLRYEAGFGGISLADCEEVIIRENEVAHNGNTHVSPVCGIFIQQGDRIDISENKIHNNGPWVENVPDSAIRKGIRGGIVIRMGVTILSSRLAEVSAAAASTREAALKGTEIVIDTNALVGIKIHDNIVSQPLGHALYIVTMSPISAQNNQLVSQGALFSLDFITGILQGTADERWEANSILYTISCLFGTVFILNLGISKDGVLTLLQMMLKTRFKPAGLASFGGNMERVSAAPGAAAAATEQPEISRVNALILPIANLPSGKTIFQDNLVLLNLKDPSFDLAVASQFIGTLDDISFSDNHSECITVNDFLWLNTMTFGITSRVVNNRFQEARFYPPQEENDPQNVAGATMKDTAAFSSLNALRLSLAFPFYSLAAVSIWQTVTNNQATHCILARGSIQQRVNNNIILLSDPCVCQYEDVYAQPVELNYSFIEIKLKAVPQMNPDELKTILASLKRLDQAGKLSNREILCFMEKLDTMNKDEVYRELQKMESSK